MKTNNTKRIANIKIVKTNDNYSGINNNHTNHDNNNNNK